MSACILLNECYRICLDVCDNNENAAGGLMQKIQTAYRDQYMQIHREFCKSNNRRDAIVKLTELIGEINGREKGYSRSNV